MLSNSNSNISDTAHTEDAIIASIDMATSDVDDKSGGKVLSSLSGPVKRKLKQAKDAYDAQLAWEQSADCSLVQENDDPTLRYNAKRSRPFYLDIPEDASKAFLSRFEAANVADLLASDWDIVKVHIRSGGLSMATNPSFTRQAMLANRLDVLAMAIQYVSDFTEVDCVRVLTACLCLPDDVITDRLCVTDGTITWGRPSTTDNIAILATIATSFPTPTPTPTRTPTATPAQTPTPTPTVKKKRKNRKDSPRAADFFTDLPGDDSMDRDSSSTGVMQSLLTLVRSLFESAILAREAAYSSMLLGEAIRNELSPSAAAFCLRVTLHLTKGLCAPTPLCAPPIHLGRRFNEKHIGRAVTWMEALIDGHFSTTVLNASVHSPTRAALTRALYTVQEAENAAIELQDVLGLWVHLHRVVFNQGVIGARPAEGLYQLETLSF